VKIVVTGASGFVGQSLVPYLRLHGHSVRSVVRVATKPEDIQVSDISSGLSADSLTDVDAVIHLAAIAHRTGTAADSYMRTNRDGAVLLAQQSAEAGVGRFIFFSTSKVYGEFSTEPFRKNDRLNPPDAYSESKALAEQAIAGLDTYMTLSFVRPPVVYGPGVAGNVGQLVRAISRGMPIPVTRHPNARSLLSIDNLTSSVQTILTAPNLNGIFQPADHGTISFEGLALTVASALGKKPRLLRVPGVALAAAQTPLSALGQQPFNAIFRDFELYPDEDLLGAGWNQNTEMAEDISRTVADFASIRN